MNEKIKIWLYKNPAFKMLVLLTLSIIIANATEIRTDFLLIIIFIIAIIILLFFKFKNTLYFISVFFAGIIISNNINKNDNILPDKILQDQKAVFNGKIKNIISYKKNSINIIAAGSLDMKELPVISNTDVLITIIKKDKVLPILKAGNEVYCNLNISFPQQKLLPGEFNEKQFLKSIGIKWRGYTNENDFAVTGNSNNLYYYRDYLLSQLKVLIFDNFSVSTSSIAFAVVSGDKSFIDAEMREKYSYAGTAHLLAVSGLHTGLISTAIYFLLFFIRNKWFKFIIFSVSLLVFVFLSGIQPSALRASAMIILYMWMYLLERPVSPLNIISLVVIASITINPSLVFSVGFQMSVSAVFGIILFYSIFYKKLKHFINEESDIQRYIITSISITLSATLITAPITAYYFGVFTFSSVFANLLSIPVFVTAVVFLLTGLILSPIPYDINKYYFKISDFLFQVNNSISDFFGSIDFFVIKDSISIYIAVAFSLIMIYLFKSNTLKHMLFKFVFVSVIVIIISFFPTKNSENYAKGIYPRKDVVAIISESQDSIKVMTIDRKKATYVRLDYGMAKYLEKSDKCILYGYSGDFGMKLNDFLKYNKNITAYKLTKSDVAKLEKQLNLCISQIIEIK